VAGTFLFHHYANCLSTHAFAKQQLATPAMAGDCKSDSFVMLNKSGYSLYFSECLPSSKVMDNKCTQESLQNVTARIWKLFSGFQLFVGSFSTISKQYCFNSFNRTDPKVVLLKSTPLVAINYGVHVFAYSASLKGKSIIVPCPFPL
jgi:hypothetical protein